MKKLKTLKDIDSFGIEFISRIKLRDIVKEWIKELDKFANDKEKFDIKYFYLFRDESTEHKDIVLDEGYESSDIRGAITWIKWFFNLEE